MKRRSLWLPAIAALILLTAFAPAYSSEFVVQTVEEDQKSPAIAYNSKADEFLVVWEDYVWQSIGTLGIAAQRVGPYGKLIGQSFAVVGEWFTFRPFKNPDLVYNPTANEYLLVWEYAHTADDHHIYARRLPSTIKAPEEVIGSDHIHIADTGKFEANPQVAFNPTDNEYLIVWEHRHVQTITTGSGTIDIIQNDIYAQRLSAAGSLLGSPLLIATTSLDQSAPAVAFGSKQNTYLVVWQETISSGEIDIYGQRIGAAGSLVGGKIAISTWQYDQLTPRLAYNNRADEFLVVWEDHHWGWGEDRDIYAQKVRGTGILQGVNFAVSWEGDDQRFHPDIAYNPAADEYLVTWEQTIWPDSPPQKPGGPVYVLKHAISQRRLASDGSLLGDEVMVSTQDIFSQTNPAIAPSDTSYLIVWEDDRNVDMALDLYGAVVKLDALTGHVYEGYTGDEENPLSNVTIELYCSNNAGWLGSLIETTTTDATGSYRFMLKRVCEYYTIIEKDPTGYFSTGASSAGMVREDNWIELTYPLSVSEMSDNDFWDIPDPPPGAWSDFTPTDWQPSRTLTCTVKVEDTGSGLDVSTAQYATRSSSSWSSWENATCTGTNGTTSPQSITATQVSFPADTTSTNQTAIKFRIADMSGSMAESPAFSVFIDTTPPMNPTVSADRSTHTWSEDAQITFSWSGASDASSGIDRYLYQWSTSSSSVPDLTLSTASTSLSTTIPTEGTHNYFHLITIDKAENRAATAVHLGPFYLDTSPPAILSGPTISSTTSSSATIIWQTTEEADSTVKYTSTAGPYTMQEAEASLVTDHSITITSLTAFTTYRFIVASTDTSGQTVESAEVTFETPGPNDTTNPTVSLIDPGVCRGMVALSATASDDRGVECVVFSIDGNAIGIDYTAPYQILWDTEKLTNKDYTIAAKAVDLSGRTTLDDLKKPVENLKDYMDPTVKITSPKDKATVSGKVDVTADLSDDTGIVSARFFVNEDYQQFEGYEVDNPPTTAEVTFTWDTTGLDDEGEYDIAIEVFDTEGHLNAHSISVNVVKEPPPPPPQIPQLKVTGHKATKIQNYFSIQLTVTNVGDKDATNVKIRDGLQGFQAIDEDITGHASFLSHWAGKYSYCEICPKLSIPKGETRTYTYYAVPVLIYPDPPDPKIGHFVDMEWRSPSSSTDSQPYHDWVTDMPAIVQGSIEKTISEAHKQAIKICDYLIVTNPKRLFSHNTNDSDVNTLFSDMARLAKQREGVLGYMDFYDSNLLRYLIKPYKHLVLDICQSLNVGCGGDWLRMLSYKFNNTLGGYLLIVGETEIVPAHEEHCFNLSWSNAKFKTTFVPISDHPYTDNNNDAYPDLIVGRIIGNTATDLSKAINSSMDNDFERSSALLASGTDGDVGIQKMFTDNVVELEAILKKKYDDKEEFDKRKIIHWKDYTTDAKRRQAFRDNSEDRDVICYSDHGGINSWDSVLVKRVDITGASALNDDFPVDLGDTNPFIFAAACLTGSYENFDDTVDSTYFDKSSSGDHNNIAEAFFDCNTSVYIGATQVSAISLNCNADKWFFNNWDADEDIGTVFTQLERDKWTGSKDYWGLWVWEYNLYGDPKFGKLTTTTEQKEVKQDKRQTPTPSLDVAIPDYVVSTRDSLDYVEIPDGKLWLEEDTYQVPYFSVSLDYPEGYRVQDVTLTNRSGLVTDTGLHLPITKMYRGGPGSTAHRNAAPPEGWFPALDTQYEWRLIENPDNTTTLIITMYPFYYHGQKTDVQFYKNYSFAIDYISTDVRLTIVTTDKAAYPQGDPVGIEMGINNTGASQDIVVSTIIKPYGSDTIADSLPLTTLKNVSGYASFAEQWDSTGFDPGYYAAEATLKDTTGNVLDTKAHMFRLGISAGEVVSLTALPSSFDPGDTIALSMDFKNTGTIPITGTAIIKVKDQSGNSIQEFSHPATNLAATTSITLNDTWDTTTVPGALYTILGYVLFDSKSSEVMTTTVSSLSDGDVAPLGNRDGIVNVGDALVALRFALGLETPTSEDIAHGDVAPLDQENKPSPDGVINVGDALVILRKALGIVVF